MVLHLSLGRCLGLWVAVRRDKVVEVLELDEGGGVLHGVIHTSVADRNAGEGDGVVWGSLVVVHDGVRPGREVMSSV